MSFKGMGVLYLKEEGVQPPWLSHVGLFPHGRCAGWRRRAGHLGGPQLAHLEWQPLFFISLNKKNP